MTDTEQERIKAICKVAHIDDISDLSDGYHTFKQLYYQRMMLFAALVKQNRDKAWKSLRHEDGELCFGGGWFIVGIDTPEGSYTYHYEDTYFSLFDCEELERGKKWDGHTEKDVTRLLSLEQEPCEELDFVQPHKKVSVNLEVCKMRKATQEEREEVDQYIDSIAYTAPSKLMAKDTCEDCISRQAAIDAFNAFADEVNQDTDIHEAIEIVLNLPPVKPAGKVGHWEWVQYDANPKIGNFHCSLCLGIGRSYYEYCPYCGHKIKETQAELDTDNDDALCDNCPCKTDTCQEGLHCPMDEDMTREQAIAIIRQEYLCVDRDCNIEKNCGKCDLAMPSKEPILEAYKMAIETLEQEPYDAVSRKEVMNMLHNHAFDYATSTKISALLKTMRGEVDRMPPVTLAEKPSKCMAPDVLNHWIGTEVLNKIQAELYANAELHEDGDYYLREEWIGEIFDKYKPGK